MIAKRNVSPARNYLRDHVSDGAANSVASTSSVVSGTSQTTPSGGMLIDADAGRPCQGSSTACTRP